MNKIKFLQMFILNVALFAIFIIAFAPKVKAETIDQRDVGLYGNVGDYVYIDKDGYFNTTQNTNIYCAWHGGDMVQGKYLISNVIEIDGNKCQIWWNYNGSIGLRGPSENINNGRLGYVLGAPKSKYGETGYRNGKNDKRQQAVWVALYNWVDNDNLGNSWAENAKNGEPSGGDLWDDSKDYAENGTASIKITNANISMNENGLIGPIEFSKTGSIKEIDVNGEALPPYNSPFNVVDENGNGIDLGTLKNEAKIYLKPTGNETAKNIKIVVSSVNYKIRACYMYRVNDTGHYQRALAVYSQEVEQTAEDEIELNTDTTLELKKLDGSNHTALDGAEFVLRHNNSYAIAQMNNGIYKVTGWTNSYNNTTEAETLKSQATKFKVTSGGIKINIPRDANLIYALEEVSPPQGYSLGTLGYVEANNATAYVMNGSTNSDGIQNENNKSVFYFNLANKKEATIVLSNSKSTTLTLHKVDKSNNSKNLAGASFVLRHNNQYAQAKQNSSGVWQITGWATDISGGTRFVTDSNGQVKIEVQQDDKLYAFEEVTPPSGYDFTLGLLKSKCSGITPLDGPGINEPWMAGIDSNGIKNSSNKSEAYFYINQAAGGEIWLTNGGGEPIAISGFVWQENPQGKQNMSNTVFDSGNDSRIENAIVKLVKKGGSSIQTKTNRNGEYYFDNKSGVTTGNIDDYYIEITYNNSKLSPIETSDVWNGSRGISSGSGVAIISDMSQYLENSTFFNKNAKDKELKWMNLGVGTGEKAQEAIEENLEYVRIQMPNTSDGGINEYVYIYGKGQDQKRDVGGCGITNNPPRVKFQNSTIKNVYSRPFYPEDVSYTKDNENKGLQVWVVYSIVIKNTNPVEGEISMDVTSLIDTYDTSRYILNKEKATDQNKDIEIVRDAEQGGENGYYGIDKWENKGNYVEHVKQQELFKNQIGHQYTSKPKNSHYDGLVSSYPNDPLSSNFNIVTEDGITTLLKDESSPKFFVQFKVTHEGIIAMLDNPKGIIEDYPTKATASVRHYYKKETIEHNHYCYKDHYIPPVYGTDKDGKKVLISPGDSWTTYHWCGGHDCTYKGYKDEGDISDDAPYLVFILNSQSRNISGKVFYDKEEDDVLGDGMYNSGDGQVKNVKVELLENGKPIMSAESDENGAYSLNGIVPGNYTLRFTYPNGGICIKGFTNNYDENTPITTANYLKSTIETSEVNEAVKGGNLWYRNINENSSIAIDDLGRRRAINARQADYLYGTGIKSTEGMDMPANSAEFTIQYENENQTSTSRDSNTHFTTNYNVFNFGIIRQPEQKASIEKVISNIKLTAQDGQTIFDGNPENLTGNIKSAFTGVSDLDGNNKNNGSTYTRDEVARETLNGATLDIRYELRVHNESETTYLGENWYKYGIKSDKTPKLKVEVSDYLDKYLTYVDVSSDAKTTVDGRGTDKNGNVITGINPAEYTKEANEILKGFHTKDYTVKKFELIADEQINGFKNRLVDDPKEAPLYIDSTNSKNYRSHIYNISYNESIDQGKYMPISLNATKVLSTQEDDWTYKNSAEIRKLSNDGTNSDLIITPEKLNFDGSKLEERIYPDTKIVITTPTGLDKKTKLVYAGIGVVALIALGSGIIIIKKKIL